MSLATLDINTGSSSLFLSPETPYTPGAYYRTHVGYLIRTSEMYNPPVSAPLTQKPLFSSTKNLTGATAGSYSPPAYIPLNLPYSPVPYYPPLVGYNSINNWQWNETNWGWQVAHNILNPTTAMDWYAKHAAYNWQSGNLIRRTLATFQDAAGGYISSFFGNAQSANQQWWGTGISAVRLALLWEAEGLLKVFSTAASCLPSYYTSYRALSTGKALTLPETLEAINNIFGHTLSLSAGILKMPIKKLAFNNISRWAIGETIDLANQLFKIAKVGGSAMKALVMSFNDQLENSTQTEVGGILLDKCATAVGNIPSITGAYWDSKQGALVLFGTSSNEKSSELKISGLEFDHFIVALRATLAGEPIGVSIDPPAEYRDGIHQGQFPPDGTPMYVSYLGNTEGTFFGAIMFEADRVMKCLSQETDNTTGSSLRAKAVRDYKSMFDLFNKFNSGGSGSWFRFWFVIDTVEIAHDPTARALRFGNVKIKVLNETELAGGGKAKPDPASAAFANHLTEYYDEYAREFPIFGRLKEIAKLSALARFLVKEGVAFDEQTIFKQPNLPVSTPEITPGIIACSPSNSGGSQLIFGGVDMDIEPTIINKNDKLALSMRDLAMNAEPNGLSSSWSFVGPDGINIASSVKLSKVNKPYRVLTGSDHAFNKSWNNSMRSIRRYYDSSVPGGDFGPGWWLFLPYRLQVIPKSMKRSEVLLQSEKKEYNNPSVIILHNFIKAVSDIYRRYKDADNHHGKAYYRITHQQLINKGLSYSVKQSDIIYFHNNFYTYSDDKFTFSFNSKGQVSETRISQGLGLLIKYEWGNGLLKEINFGSGKKYDIKYDTNNLIPKISEIVASDGVAINYNFNNGLLRECLIGNSKKVSYHYDQQNRISETRNGDGIVVKRNTYDSNGNNIEISENSSTLSDGTELKRDLLNGRILKVKDESGGSAEYTYQKDGCLTSIRTILEGRETGGFYYGEDGKLCEMKDSLGINHKILYQTDGQIKRVEGDDGSWVEFPTIDKLNEEICGSNGYGDVWKVKRNKSGLPETIIDSNQGKHKFIYDKNGLKSIISPGASFNILQNNRVAEFEMKYNTGLKQKVFVDRETSKARVSVKGQDGSKRELVVNENYFMIEDCAGTAEYKFDKNDLICEAVFVFT